MGAVLLTRQNCEKNNRRSETCIRVRGGTAPKSPWLLSAEFLLVDGGA
jgi:hypothetical protein